METKLASHSAYFTSMVALIPQQFYSVKEKDQEDADNKYWINKKQARAPKQSVKEASKKAKRLKFDPENQKAPDSEELTLEGLVEDTGEQQVENGIGEGAQPGFSVERVRSGDLSDLQERLKHKIEALRGKRKVREFDEPSDVAEKRAKRAERKKKKKEMRQKQKTKAQTAPTKTEDSGTKRPCVKDESGRLVFSKFDFTTPPSVEASSSTKTVGQKKKDYQKLLAKAEAAQKKLKEIKEKDLERGEELLEKAQWQRAVEKAKGSKLKDDPQLLKKTIKKIEKRKDKSRKQWSTRQKAEDQSKEKRQEKRAKNIRERTEHIKAKKMRKRRKPGF